MSRKIPRVNLSQEVANGILDMIESREILTREKIPTESELTKIFGVSRTAVREGIRDLVAIGVLETKRGVGTFVRDSQPGPLRHVRNSGAPSQSHLLDLLEFRQIIEPEIAALAARRRTPKDIREMERCVHELSIGVKARTKPPEDLGFHTALAQATQNTAFIDASSLVARFHDDDPNPPDEMDIEEHAAILEAVRVGDEEKARELMHSHIHRTVEQRSQALSDDGSSPG
jgi:DNA-binding FadR family transcriptional regulator